MEQRQREVQSPQRVQHEIPQPPRRQTERHDEEVATEHVTAYSIAEEYYGARDNRQVVEHNRGEEGE